MSSESELQELKKRVAELEDAAKPKEPFVPGPRFQFDPTAGASMPRSAMKAMIDAVPDALMRDLRSDAMKPNPVTGGPNPQPQPQVRRGSGWRDEVPLENPAGSGQRYIDAIVDEADRRDKVELAMSIAKTRAAMKQAGGPTGDDDD
jgi:hypothetical protein